MENKLIQRIIITAIGLTTCGMGIGLFLFSNLGVDPASVFQLGIANQLKINYGTASAAMNIIIIVFMIFIDKRYINIATVMAIFLIGYTADFTNTILHSLVSSNLSFALQIIFSIVGCLVMAIGIPMYTGPGLGVGAIDLLSEIITDRLHVQYRFVRITMDAFFVIVGYLLGGVFGIGTIIAVVLTGPIVQVTRPYINNLINYILGGSNEQ